jgi:hypothetical protein
MRGATPQTDEDGGTGESSSTVEGKLEAEKWLRATIARFAKVFAALSRFDSAKVVDEIKRWPTDLRTSWRAQMILAKAKFEALDYGQVLLSRYSFFESRTSSI